MTSFLRFFPAVLFISAVFFHESAAADRFLPVGIKDVAAGGEIGRRIDITVNNNLLKADLENDFLKPFREKSSKGGYIGIGKTIDAAARFAAYTRDERVIAAKNFLVDGVIAAQEPDGYIGLMAPGSRMWSHWDVHEMVYIVYGLVSDYRLFGSEKSLAAARKTADYIIRKWPEMPADWPRGVHLVMTNTGIDRAFLALSASTGIDTYKNFLIDNLGLANWDLGIVLGRHGDFKGHAYAYMARCLAQLELYRENPDEALLEKSRGVIDFLTRHDGLLVTGACGYQECWHYSQIVFFKLGETCATAYLIRFLDNLLRLEGISLYGDMMERAVYNALFAAQSPKGRKLRYYAPFEGERIYFDRDTYCCPCNYRRIVSELPGMIYYRTDNGGIAVNLYTESKATVTLDNGMAVRIRQETGYPHSGKVNMVLEPSGTLRFSLKLRIPRWCGEGVRLAINGDYVSENIRGGSFHVIEREWKAGDRVVLEMPMNWRIVKGRKAQAGRAAVMRGPLLFCLNPALNATIKSAELPLLRLDFASLSGPENTDAVHPGGIACRAKMWSPEQYAGEPDLSVLLTEFADPGGLETYFLAPDPEDKRMEDDELMTVQK